jgi:hypothetical protein
MDISVMIFIEVRLYIIDVFAHFCRLSAMGFYVFLTAPFYRLPIYVLQNHHHPNPQFPAIRKFKDNSRLVVSI